MFTLGTQSCWLSLLLLLVLNNNNILWTSVFFFFSTNVHRHLHSYKLLPEELYIPLPASLMTYSMMKFQYMSQDALIHSIGLLHCVNQGAPLYMRINEPPPPRGPPTKEWPYDDVAPTGPQAVSACLRLGQTTVTYATVRHSACKVFFKAFYITNFILSLPGNN